MKYKDENGNWQDLSVKVMDSFPIGGMVGFGGSIAPQGWLICDGRAVSRTKYKKLFDTIGVTYGEGDGSTTFNIPNPKGRVLVGLDTSQGEFNVIGKIGGEKEHTLTMFELPNTVWQNHTDLQEGGIKALFDNGSNYGIGSNGNNFNKPFSIVQPYLVANYIIKAEDNVASIQSNKNVYSTDEQIIGTWIDGKPIYRKVLNINIKLISNMWIDIEDVSNLNIDTLTDKIFYREGDYAIYSVMYTRVENDKLQCFNSGDDIVVRVVIEYTKTTD